jgi:hypothetical protein
MATVITIADIIAQFGAYYIDSQQNLDRIHQQLFEVGGTQDAFTTTPTEDTVLRYSEAEVSEVLQPYQDAFTAKGGVDFKPVSIPLYQVKVDQRFNPNNLAASWLGFLTDKKTDRTTWPFIKWFIEAYLLPKIKEDMELAAIYKGVYVAPTAGTPGAASTSMNGVRKLINDGITATDITAIVTGAPNATPATWAGQVETFLKAIPEKYWATPMELNMSRTLALRFKEGMRTKYNLNYALADDLSTLLDFPVTVKGRGSMIGSNKIWMTPKNNARRATKWGENQNMFEIEKVDREVKIYTDWWEGVGLVIPGIVFTNDQDLV